MCSIERKPSHLLNPNGNATDQTFESVHQSVARHMSQETSTNVAIVVSLCLYVSELFIYILFLMLQVLISDIATNCPIKYYDRTY